MAAVRWPWPGSSATRPARRSPWACSASPPFDAGDPDGAVRLARQAAQITAGVPGSIARWRQLRLTIVADRGRGPGRRRACLRGGAGPVPGRRRPGAPGEPADTDGDAGPARRAASRTPRRTCGKRSRSPRGPATGRCRGNALDCCGHLCAATGRSAEAVTVWAAVAALCSRRSSRMRPPTCAAARKPCARPGRRSDPPGPGRRRTAARR